MDELRLKDELISNIVEELRTPLTNMKTALTLLNSPHLKPIQRQRYLEVLHKECDRQTTLINSLLALIQLERDLERDHLRPLQLADIIPGIVSTYQPLAREKGIILGYTIPQSLPPISCLENWLKQVVIQLLDNAIKFTPRGGQVSVKAKSQEDYVQVEFRDTGIGIPHRELPRIFDRFYRIRQGNNETLEANSDSQSPLLETHSLLSGAGLGLTLVQQILIQCGGSVTVQSRVGEGSIFNVMLPIYRNN